MKPSHVHNSLMVFGLAIFSMTIALYVYMYMEVDSQTMRVVTARDNQRVQELDAKQVDNIKDLFERTRDGRSDLGKLFVSKEDAIKFIESIESIGPQTGAVLDLGGVTEIKSDGPISKLKAHIEAKGSWNQVSKVLIILETMQKSVSVDSVRFNNLGFDGTSSSWSLSLNITANII